MNKEELKQRTIVLERELEAAAPLSADVAAFAKYEPLVSAIKRAKALEISETEEIPGMRYWMFETEIPGFSALSDAFANFHLLLRGLEA